MEIHSRTVGPFMENSYLVIDPSTRLAAYIDPGDEAEMLIELAEANDCKPIESVTVSRRCSTPLRSKTMT